MEKFIKFITNEKFYLPIVYIVVGLILYLVIEKVINRISKGHIGNSGKDKRKDTIINLGRSIFKYFLLCLGNKESFFYRRAVGIFFHITFLMNKYCIRIIFLTQPFCLTAVNIILFIGNSH